MGGRVEYLPCPTTVPQCYKTEPSLSVLTGFDFAVSLSRLLLRLEFNWHIHSHTPGRQPNAVFVIHCHAWVVALEQCYVGSLCFDILDELFCLLALAETVLRGRVFCRLGEGGADA